MSDAHPMTQPGDVIDLEGLIEEQNRRAKDDPYSTERKLSADTARALEVLRKVYKAAEVSVIDLKKDRRGEDGQHPNHAHRDGVHWDDSNPPKVCEQCKHWRELNTALAAARGVIGETK